MATAFSFQRLKDGGRVSGHAWRVRRDGPTIKVVSTSSELVGKGHCTCSKGLRRPSLVGRF